jgi:uncharacterized membrane protein YbhN (UPF0104 family)
LFVAKLIISGSFFWYALKQINVAELARTISFVDFRWAMLAVALLILQIPLAALRWHEILDALGGDERITRTTVTIITAIGLFFGQVLPNVVGEGIRIWLLTRLGCDWRYSITSVVIDRAVGTGLLITVGVGALLLPSTRAMLGLGGDHVLIFFAAFLLTGIIGLVSIQQLSAAVAKGRYSSWIAQITTAARRVLLSPRGITILGVSCFIHALTIVAICSLGWALGIVLPPLDLIVLFSVMVGIALVPISIGGWGLREAAVVTLLGNHGVAPERALMFSMCFGATVIIATLPGALAWLVYSASRLRSSSGQANEL